MQAGENSETISLEDARSRMGTDATVLDIRPDEEWQKVGNIPGAIAAGEDDAEEAAKKIDEESTVVVVCEDGDRSAEVAERLRESGRDAVALEGGMAAWASNDLPMQPTEDPALASDPGSVEDEVSDSDGEDDSDSSGDDDSPAGDERES